MFLPLGDNQPKNHEVYVTWLIIAACILTYLYMQTMPNQDEQFAYIRHFSLIPKNIFNTDHPPGLFALFFKYNRLVTYQYMHADIYQLFLNTLVLVYCGPTLERRCGPGRFMAFYTICGIVAGYCQVDLAGPDNIMRIYGASGAAAGLFGGYLCLIPDAMMRVLSLVVFLRMFLVSVWICAFSWFSIQLTAIYTGTTPGQSFITLGCGFIAGAVMISFIRRKDRDLHPDELVKPRQRNIFDDLLRAPPPPGKGPWEH